MSENIEINKDYFARYLASVTIVTAKQYDTTVAALSCGNILANFLAGLNKQLTPEQISLGDSVMDLVEYYVKEHYEVEKAAKVIDNPQEFDEELRKLLDDQKET